MLVPMAVSTTLILSIGLIIIFSAGLEKFLSVPVAFYAAMLCIVVLPNFSYGLSSRGSISIVFCLCSLLVMALMGSRFLDERVLHSSAGGLVLSGILIACLNFAVSGSDVFSISESGKNLLHNDVKEGQSVGGNKNNVASGCFYSIVGVVSLYLMGKVSRITLVSVCTCLLSLIGLLLSTRYFISGFVLVSVLVSQGSVSGFVMIPAALLVGLSLFNPTVQYILELSFYKAAAMVGMSGLDSYADKAASGRLDLLKGSFLVLDGQFFHGIGIENIRLLGTFSHIDAVEIFVAGGVFGIAFYAVFWLVLWRKLRVLSVRGRASWVDILWISPFLILPLVGSVYNNPIYWFSLYVLFGSIGVFRDRLVGS